jgi:phage-related protein
MASAALPLQNRISNNPTITRNEKIKKAGLGDGYEARAPQGKNWVFYTIELRWESLTWAELGTIKTAITTVNPDGWFTYALPDDGISRKWTVENFDYALLNADLANANIKLKEVFR